MFGFGKKKKDGASESKKSESEGKRSEREIEQSTGEGGGFLSFWQTYVLREKSKDESEKPLTSEEKNQLAAEVATSSLGLDTKARKQVAKAIAAEMRRRHEERERRRKELMAQTMVQLPWGQKPTTAAVSTAPEEAPKQAVARPKLTQFPPKPGSSMYPIKMELKSSAKAAKVGKQEAERHTWDDSQWRPVAAVASTGPTLEQQRKEWITKSLKAAVGPQPKSTKQAPADAKQAEQQIFGAQPTVIQMDDAAVQEIHAHTFGQMLQNILLEAAQQQQKAELKAATTKKPENMTPDELVELRKQDAIAWDKHTRQNTVISFGLTTPTEEDMEQRKKMMGKKKDRQIQFDDEVEVAQAPVGRDFHFNEKLQRSSTTLKK